MNCLFRKVKFLTADNLQRWDAMISVGKGTFQKAVLSLCFQTQIDEAD